MSELDSTDTDLRSRYEAKRPVLGRLEDEVVFSLQQSIASTGIKIHSITGRLKSIESIHEKAIRKECDDPLVDMTDLVGVRVVALFLSDLVELDQLIRAHFDVHETESTIEGRDPTSFGYMSVHYIATLQDEHSGPRYDDLKGERFELQLRTIVMDAWATISHYLDYKGESTIPSELRRDFFALSGLFHVADQHFELFADRSTQAQKEAKQEVKRGSAEVMETNLDTVAALFAEMYPDRKHAERSSVADFVQEVANGPYGDFRVLKQSLERGNRMVKPYEASHPPHNAKRFADVGAARVALSIVDPDFAAGRLAPERYEPFREQLDS